MFQIQARDVGKSGRRNAGALASSGGDALAAGRDGHGSTRGRNTLLLELGGRLRHRRTSPTAPSLALPRPLPLPIPGQPPSRRHRHAIALVRARPWARRPSRPLVRRTSGPPVWKWEGHGVTTGRRAASPVRAARPSRDGLRPTVGAGTRAGADPDRDARARDVTERGRADDGHQPL